VSDLASKRRLAVSAIVLAVGIAILLSATYGDPTPLTTK
jgi:hypothetical protein